MIRKIVFLIFVAGLVTLSYNPLMLLIDGEKEPVKVTGLQSLRVNTPIKYESQGPYGVLSTTEFLLSEAPKNSFTVQEPKYLSFEKAASTRAEVNHGELYSIGNQKKLIGVGSVVNDNTIAKLLTYDDAVIGENVKMLVAPEASGLNMLGLATSSLNQAERVTSKSPKVDRDAVSKLGDISYLINVWASTNPEISFLYDKNKDFKTNITPEKKGNLPSVQKYYDSITAERKQFEEDVLNEITGSVTQSLAKKQYAIGAPLVSYDTSGLFTMTKEGLALTARGVAYSFMAKAVTPGSVPVGFSSSNIRGIAFQQPDGDIALIVHTWEKKPLQIDINLKNRVARYNISQNDDEVNLIILPNPVGK